MEEEALDEQAAKFDTFVMPRVKDVSSLLRASCPQYLNTLVSKAHNCGSDEFYIQCLLSASKVTMQLLF